ncbi:MAG: hypothetical protein NDI90_20910 [Nitrospira sp. BO4]|nr:hypothetical protein [Nitrospira sp. BO4]
MTAFAYKERSIQLWPGLKDDGTWLCRYFIIENGNIISGLIYPDAHFSTRREAEAAALKAAQDVIDAREPLGTPICDR